MTMNNNPPPLNLPPTPPSKRGQQNGRATAPAAPSPATLAAPTVPAPSFTGEVILPGDEVTLSSGVVLRLKSPASWAITEVVRQMAPLMPEPPMVNNPDRGRAEPNEADPAYQRALKEWQDRELERKYEVVIATGTSVVHIPDDVKPPESDDWLEVLAAIGMPQPVQMSLTERYIRWIKYVAAPGQDDWILLVLRLRPRVGTPEEEVAVAAETFRGDAQRGGA